MRTSGTTCGRAAAAGQRRSAGSELKTKKSACGSRGSSSRVSTRLSATWCRCCAGTSRPAAAGRAGPGFCVGAFVLDSRRFPDWLRLPLDSCHGPRRRTPRHPRGRSLRGSRAVATASVRPRRSGVEAAPRRARRAGGAPHRRDRRLGSLPTAYSHGALCRAAEGGVHVFMPPVERPRTTSI